jgi:CRP-like cAMP-binding protein
MVSKEELRRQILFEDTTEPQLTRLAKTLTEISLKKGDTLFTEGDNTKGIYLIRSGKIEISKATPDGWKQTLAVFIKHHFFGELSIMEKRLHEADATALEASKLLLLSKEVFEELEEENVELALNIIRKIAIVMSKNIRRMNNKFLAALINY